MCRDRSLLVLYFKEEMMQPIIQQQCGKTHTFTLVTIILFAIIAMTAGIIVANKKSSASVDVDLSQLDATILQTPRAISDFSLTDNQNNTFSNSNLLGHWTMMFFGFTHCPYLCPTTMAALNSMQQQLIQDGITQLPQVVLISIDPARDDSQALDTYVKSFNSDFIGATGDQANLGQLSQELGIAYVAIPSQNDNPMNYDIEHSSAIILFNPQGELAGFFTMPHDSEVMAKDYEIIVSTHSLA